VDQIYLYFVETLSSWVEFWFASDGFGSKEVILLSIHLCFCFYNSLDQGFSLFFIFFIFFIFVGVCRLCLGGGTPVCLCLLKPNEI
jgi:hypothetical protein